MVPGGDHPATAMVPCDAVFPMIPAPVLLFSWLQATLIREVDSLLVCRWVFQITRFSSTVIRNGSSLIQENSTHVVGGFALDASVACLCRSRGLFLCLYCAAEEGRDLARS